MRNLFKRIKNITAVAKSLRKAKRGVVSLEYGLLAAIVGVGIVTGASQFSKGLNDQFVAMATWINGGTAVTGSGSGPTSTGFHN